MYLKEFPSGHCSQIIIDFVQIPRIELVLIDAKSEVSGLTGQYNHLKHQKITGDGTKIVVKFSVILLAVVYN